MFVLISVLYRLSMFTSSLRLKDSCHVEVRGLTTIEPVNVVFNLRCAVVTVVTDNTHLIVLTTFTVVVVTLEILKELQVLYFG